MAHSWWVERKQGSHKAPAEGAMGRGGSGALPEVAVNIRRLRPAPNQAAAWARLWRRLLAPIETDAEEDSSGQGSSDGDVKRGGGDR
jgi:hypothetical protein